MRFSILTVFLALVWNVPALAGIAPDELVRQQTDKVLEEVQQNKEEYGADKKKLFNTVHRHILPYVDFERFARLVLGKNWKKADEAQRVQFTDEFQSLLIHTYATALFSYSGEQIVYKPLKFKQGETRAAVNMEFVPNSGPSIPFQYSMHLADSGDWKVYDIKIDGVSLVTNYRASYGSIINQKGMQELLDMLAKKNHELMNR